jgi:hypothetical protein
MVAARREQPVRKLLFNDRMEDMGRVYDKFEPQRGGLIVMQNRETALIDAQTERILIPYSQFGLEKKGACFISDFKYDSTKSTTADGRLHGLYDRKGKMVLAPDSVDIHVFPDDSYFIFPHYKKVMQYAEHHSKTGELLRNLDRVSDYVNWDHWFRSSKKPEGKYIFSTFSYLDPRAG